MDIVSSHEILRNLLFLKVPIIKKWVNQTRKKDSPVNKRRLSIYSIITTIYSL